MLTDTFNASVKATVNVGAITRRIARIVAAELDDSWKGGGDPAHWPEIELELQRAHKSLADYLREKRIT